MFHFNFNTLTTPFPKKQFNSNSKSHSHFTFHLLLFHQKQLLPTHISHITTNIKSKIIQKKTTPTTKTKLQHLFSHQTYSSSSFSWQKCQKNKVKNSFFTSKRRTFIYFQNQKTKNKKQKFNF